MNIFNIHKSIISDYQMYISSFIDIADDRIRNAVEQYFSSLKPWPEALIKFNPALHEYWAWKYCTTLKTDLVYTPTNTFKTFPFPPSIETPIELEKNAKEYHEFCSQLMLDMQLGLTKTYNLFHDPQCNSNNIDKAKEIREFKNVNLQIPIEEAIPRIEKLRVLYKEMDEVVLQSYGWIDINLAHNFYEVDYLPKMTESVTPSL